jgi:hypothetical protein
MAERRAITRDGPGCSVRVVSAYLPVSWILVVEVDADGNAHPDDQTARHFCTWGCAAARARLIEIGPAAAIRSLFQAMSPV